MKTVTERFRKQSRIYLQVPYLPKLAYADSYPPKYFEQPSAWLEMLLLTALNNT